MKASCIAAIIFSACAAEVSAQSADPVYRVAVPGGANISHVARANHGREALVDLPAGRGTLSLGLFKDGNDGYGKMMEYVDQQVEQSIQNFTRDSNSVLMARPVGFNDIDLDRRHRAWGMSVGFDDGPFAIRVAHQNKHVTKVAPATSIGNIMDAKNTVLAANVNLGVAKVYAAFSVNRGWGSSPLWNPDNPYSAALASTPSTDSRDLMLGMAVPFGQTTLLASFIRKNDRDLANRDANQMALGATYALSRRTDFFAAYSHTTSRAGAGLRIGNVAGVGQGVSALNIGMRHSF